MSEDTTIAKDNLSDLLLAAAPGQFDAILADLRVLIPGLPDSFVEESRRAHRQATAATLPDRSAGDGGEHEGVLSSRLEEHLRARFSAPGVVTSHAVSAAADDGLRAMAYAERASAENCRGGSWRIGVQVRALSARQASIRGEIRVRANCYEGGNCMLDAERRWSAVTVTAAEGKTWADAVIDQMDQWEAQMGAICAGMGDGTLKRLRRVMPVTRTKMDWNAAGHRLVQTLNESKK